MFINLTRTNKHTLTVDITDEQGNILLVPRKINRYSERDINWLLRFNPEWTLPEINQVLLELCEGESEEGEVSQTAFEVDIPAGLIESNKTSNEPFVIHVREITQLKKHGTAFQNVDPQSTLRECFDDVTGYYKEPLIEWSDKEKLCCLDIDYHDLPFEQRPQYEELEKIVAKIKPQPFCWHMSHGNGCKLYYVYSPGYTADELATVAGIQWKQLDNRSTFDLIKSTRHPCYERSRDKRPAPCESSESINYIYGQADLSSIRRILTGNLDDEEITELLETKGWRIGQTLPHSECPIEPTGDSKECVYIGDTGVYCHKCNANGYGISGSGFLPYSTFIGTFDKRIGRMVRFFCHNEHASIILEHTYPGIPCHHLEKFYKVLLKITHGPDDPRIRLAFSAGKGFVRTQGQWISSDGKHSLQHNVPQFIKSLPAVLIPKEDGYTLNVSAATQFSNTCDLSEYGYDDISFLKGCKIYGVHNSYTKDEIVKFVSRSEFRRCPPTYLIRSKRIPSEHAWGLLDDCFPGIDHKYVRLLIAMKGVSEGKLAQCPYILVTGPSGAGKSTTVHIAAGITGDKAAEPIWMPQVDRFRQSMMDASQESGYVLVNEIFKMADRAGMSAVQALDPMLSLTPDSRSHKMYVGSVPFGRLPVFVITDINIPKEVEQDIQLSRRFTFYRLTKRNSWEQTFAQKKIEPHEFRLISHEHNQAADTILSEVIDDFFSEPTTLQEIVKSLEIQSLESLSEDIDNTKDLLRRFYVEVCNAPPLMGSDAQRYPGIGWKKISRIDINPLVELWNDLCDGQMPEQWVKSRTIDAEDWSRLLKTDVKVIFECRAARNNMIYCRFRSADSPRNPTWCNGRLLI